ncbi:uncharacterized mitochondrial protein-like protein, partial [Tanacetum coccineum]
VEAMQEELLQFKIQKVWTLVNLPSGKKAIDDIIFGSTKKSLCDEFEKIMHNRFQMSLMGELTFFLGLQVKQKKDWIFISQDKYVGEILKKFGFSSVRTASTLMETNKALTKDEDGEDVDVHLYRSMIGSLMYLTSSRPDIMFLVCVCSRFQVQPKVSHLHAVKRIFRYLKGQPKLGLWYPKDSPFILEAFSDYDYAGSSLDKKSTTGSCRFLSSRYHFIIDSYEKRLVEMVKIHTDNNVADLLTKAFDVGFGEDLNNWDSFKGEGLQLFWNTTTSKIVNSMKQIHAIVDGKAVIISESSVRSDLLFNDKDGVACLTNNDIFENLALMGRTKKDIELPQTSVPLDHRADEAVHKEGVTEIGSGDSLRLQETIGGAYAQTRSEIASKKSYDPPLSEVNTSRSGEDSIEYHDDLMDFIPPTPNDSPLSGGHTPGSDKGRPNFKEMMNICITLSNRVLTLEEAKTAQDRVITRLKLRVKRLEKKRKARTPQPMKRRLFKSRVESSTDKSLDEEDASK